MHPCMEQFVPLFRENKPSHMSDLVRMSYTCDVFDICMYYVSIYMFYMEIINTLLFTIGLIINSDSHISCI